MVSNLSQREIAVVLTMRGNFNKELQSAERGLLKFRSELKRASIQFGAMAAGGILALRQWTRAAEDNRASMQLVASAITSAGGNAATVTPKLEKMFKALSEQSGVKIGDVRDAWLELFREFGNADLATQLAPAAVALEAITGQSGAAELLAKALTGETGAVEELRKLSGIDLSPFNTTAERLDAILTGGLAERIAEAAPPTAAFSVAMDNLKTALGEGAAKAFEGPLNTLAVVFQKFAENEALTTFAGTFTAIATAILLIGASLSGLLWLTATHPVILGLIALAAAVAGVVAAYQTLNALFGSEKDTRPGAPGTPTEGVQSPGENLEHAAGRHVLRLMESQKNVQPEDLASWLEWAQRDTLAKFPGLTAEQLRNSFEWQQLVALITERIQVWAATTPGQQLPGPFAPVDPGEQDRGVASSNVMIYSNGDLDWERRVRELAERQNGIGFRGVL